MADRTTDIVNELRRGMEETIALFGGLDATAMAQPVYTEQVQWSVHRVLAHLITIEKTMHWLFRNILEGGSGTPEDFDVDRFNRTQPQKLDDLSREQLIQRFREVRGDTIQIVEQMTESDLDREGRHPWHGWGRLERFVRWAYEHVRLHEQDVRAACRIPPEAEP